MGFYRRHFLNKPKQHSTAFLLAEIDDYSGTVTIGDSIHKLDTLIRDLEDFKQALCKEHSRKKKR